MTYVPDTAAARTRMVQTAMGATGVTCRVVSDSGSHRAQLTTVDECADLAFVAAYLGGYLLDMADVEKREGFVSVVWNTGNAAADPFAGIDANTEYDATRPAVSS